MIPSRLNSRNQTRDKDPLRVPREGTKLRKLYDELATGNTIKNTDFPEFRSYFDQLQNFYNCELIRNNGRSYMTGRWDGDYFVPVERLNE